MIRVRDIATWPIIFYQKTLSFDHGPMRHWYPNGYCPFYPTCSEYARRAILEHGIFHGILLGIWRILRCHPWTKGGVDHP